MEQQKQCNIDDVELIRTNWCSNEQRKEKICFHSPSTIPISNLHGPNMRPLKLLSSTITGKKEHQKHLSKHVQSQTNQQVASLLNKKKYFFSSHLQASKQAAAPLEHAYQQQQHDNSSSPDDLSGSSTTTPSACLPNQKE